MFSGSGIAVRALLLATSLPLTLVLPLTPGRFVRLYFSGWFAILEVLVLKCLGSRSPGLLRFSRSALGSGVPVKLSPFRGCLSGSSEHVGGGLGELLRTSGGHVFCLIARLRPGLGVFG